MSLAQLQNDSNSSVSSTTKLMLVLTHLIRLGSVALAVSVPAKQRLHRATVRGTSGRLSSAVRCS